VSLRINAKTGEVEGTIPVLESLIERVCLGMIRNSLRDKWICREGEFLVKHGIVIKCRKVDRIVAYRGEPS
jgi:hypothetical protein